MLTYVIFFLILAIATGVFSMLVRGPLPPIMFVVSFILFLWSGIMYMRERRRGSRR
jgi:ABC-type polysaccharide/polyol phosphate export permease